MSKLWAVSLAAIVACLTTEAQAAKYLIVDIAAKGNGVASFGSRVGAFPTRTYAFEVFTTSLSYILEGGLGPRDTGTGISVVGSLVNPLVTGNFTSNGFNFSANYPFSQFLSYNISGNACYANGAPATVTIGTPTVDQSCSFTSFRYSDGFSITNYNFTGTVTDIKFRVMEADFLPDIAFAIPEPATWALMLAGFGMVGYAMRRRRPRIVYA